MVWQGIVFFFLMFMFIFFAIVIQNTVHNYTMIRYSCGSDSCCLEINHQTCVLIGTEQNWKTMIWMTIVGWLRKLQNALLTVSIILLF